MTGESEKAELEAALKQGDSDALAQYIEMHRPRLMSVLDRKVGAGLRRKLELEDIFREVVARALKDLPRVDFDGQQPLGWIYMIMDRQIVDLHRYHFEARKRDAGREVSVDKPTGDQTGDFGFAQLLIASMTTPSMAMSRDVKLLQVQRAIAALSEDMQNAIRWRYLENLSSREISKRLGKTDAATRVLLSRAIRKLQQTTSE